MEGSVKYNILISLPSANFQCKHLPNFVTENYITKEGKL